MEAGLSLQIWHSMTHLTWSFRSFLYNVSCRGKDCNLGSEKKAKKPRAGPCGTGRTLPHFPAGKSAKPLAFSRVRDIVRNVNCNGGRFAWQRGKSGLHRAGSPSSRRMSRGQPRGKESATENRPPDVFGRTARVKRRCKRPPGSGAIRAAWQAPSGARPNRGRCRCPRRYQFRVLAA